ncbi:hypothetical protein L21SP3_00385 [Sedimentisphaera cyanobacteriorum]|uniref:Ig-like domain-containing protein n=1 Tax=Sedimentisphaera cyanobacteriorum TaxID=1940790 RepID=A0A1Q2HMC6_9BACT|nr:LamG-like jellyroll fold domain-containing protein [Sedimentisphaera cyanobacteriorum]AQQ08598.1 hypothetical protein L21SP3_00385 [Sedimentisphaera cyanobacteriorum]
MKFFMTIIIAITVLTGSLYAQELNLVNSTFDEGEEISGELIFPDGWTGFNSVNRVYHCPDGSLGNAGYVAEESHIRYGWSDGCGITQNETLSGVTLPVIQADTVYTLAARVRMDEDSSSVGVGLQMLEGDSSVIIEEDHFNTGTGWVIYELSFDSGDMEYSHTVGSKLAPAVKNYGGNNWQMIDYVKLFEGNAVWIVQQPQSQLVQEGEDAQFSVSLNEPVTPCSYEWYSSPDKTVGDNDVFIESGSSELTVSDVQLSDSGGYYYCVVSGSDFSITTNTARLEVERLMAHWKLDSNLQDSSPNGWDGTAATTNYVSGGGIDGDCCQFTNNLNETIEIPESSEAFNNYETGLTVSFWKKYDSANTDWEIAISKSTSNGNGWEIGTHKHDNSPFFGFRAMGALNSEINIIDGQWHHIVGTFNGSDAVRLYVDGELDLETFGDYDVYPNNTNIMIGRRNQDGKELPVSGYLDEIKVFNYDVGAEGAVDLYNEFAAEQKIVCIQEYAQQYDVTGPEGEPDCVVDQNDLYVILINWLEDNTYPQVN